MLHNCSFPSGNQNSFHCSFSINGTPTAINHLIGGPKLTNFKYAIGAVEMLMGHGVAGDGAIWMPFDNGWGLKLILGNANKETISAIQEADNQVFPKIKWVEDAVVSIDDQEINCVAVKMEDVNKTPCQSTHEEIVEKCIDAFESLKLWPEDEWYKKTNLINGKIVDFHDFRELKSRYEFPYDCDSEILKTLYHEGPRSHTRKKDIGRITKKDTLYQGFRFANNVQLKGYSSNKAIFDSYRKLPFMPFRKLENGRVLDIGCNQGFFTFQALMHGASEIVAVEYDKQHLDFAKKMNKLVFKSDKITFIESDANTYLDNYKGPKFDVIIMLSVLHQMYPHMKDSDKFLSKIASLTDYFAFENPTNHPKMKISNEEVSKILKKHFKVVRYLYNYDAYSPGSRSIFVCYS